MSRIGNLPVSIPDSITITVEKNGQNLTINGPKGSLKLNINSAIQVEVAQNQIMLKRKNDQKRIKSLHGLIRNILHNMVLGVTQGWSKDLELVGVGFRAQVLNNKLILNVGFSHPVEVEAVEGIIFEVSDNTKIKVSGIDKQLVGQVAANIKKIRPPDVYKGKGIRFVGEYIRKKVGKSAKVGAAVGAAGAK